MIENFIINGKRAIAAKAGELLKNGILENDPKEVNKKQLLVLFGDGKALEINNTTFKAMKMMRDTSGEVVLLETEYEDEV